MKYISSYSTSYNKPHLIKKPERATKDLNKGNGNLTPAGYYEADRWPVDTLQ